MSMRPAAGAQPAQHPGVLEPGRPGGRRHGGPCPIRCSARSARNSRPAGGRPGGPCSGRRPAWGGPLSWGNDQGALRRGRLMRYGGIEAGGTKWVCAVAEQPGQPLEIVRFPTTAPAETVARAARFFIEHGPIDVLGVGAFGPVDIHRDSPTWGTITTTPKPGWGDTDLTGALTSALGVPIALDTDVNAAALGEWRWGAATGLDTS